MTELLPDDTETPEASTVTELVPEDTEVPFEVTETPPEPGLELCV